MIYAGAIIAILFILLTGYLLMKQINPQAVLITTGLMMLIVALLLGTGVSGVTDTTVIVVFDLFIIIKETLTNNLMKVGLIISTIVGDVVHMLHIKPCDVLVLVAMQASCIFYQ